MTPGPYSQAVTFQAARTGSASRLPVTPRGCTAPAESPAPVRTETRHGVLYVVDLDGAPVAPVASPALAQSYGRALRAAGLRV